MVQGIGPRPVVVDSSTSYTSLEEHGSVWVTESFCLPHERACPEALSADRLPWPTFVGCPPFWTPSLLMVISSKQGFFLNNLKLDSVRGFSE